MKILRRSTEIAKEWGGHIVECLIYSLNMFTWLDSHRRRRPFGPKKLREKWASRIFSSSFMLKENFYMFFFFSFSRVYGPIQGESRKAPHSMNGKRVARNKMWRANLVASVRERCNVMRDIWAHRPSFFSSSEHWIYKVLEGKCGIPIILLSESFLSLS